MPRVAIIGGGPSGIASARWLKHYGFEPVIFEQSDRIGGQWNASGELSGVWPSMRANTSRTMTSFSDLRHQADVSIYPHNSQVLEYLQRYATKFGVNSYLRTSTRVESIDLASGGKFLVRSRETNGQTIAEIFDRVIVAAGRYNHPAIPQVNGLDSFCGHGGFCHTFRYKDPHKYRSMRVLVAGCSISALEIASDLAMLGAHRVVTTYRRPRYVAPKMVAGVPTDNIAFTRWSALAGELLPTEMQRGLKNFILRTMGSPQQYGAFPPDDDISSAGITLSQYFLPLVAEGRITTKPWISEIEGERVTFADGTTSDFDAIIFATGYKLSLPHLSPAIQTAINADENRLYLDRFTFHPSVPGLAFIGMYQQTGPYFPCLELQARLIAYTWAGIVPQVPETEMFSRIASMRAQHPQPCYQVVDAMALMFSRSIGTEPDVAQYPSYARALLFGPLAAASFRVAGPDPLPDALERVREDASAFGAITSPELTPEQQAQLAMLRKAQGAHSVAAATRAI